MTPGARLQAAIEVLDRILVGGSAERELTAWARGSRYAGSGDRAAVRDHVYDALRRLRSSAWAGGLGDVELERMAARQVMAGLLSGQGTDPATLFTGQGHAPAPIEEMPVSNGQGPEGVRLDIPDWLLPQLRASLGHRTEEVLLALRERAPVTVRANVARTTPESLIARLGEAGIAARAGPLSPTAVTICGKARGLTMTEAFAEGLFEMQDAGSQALVDRLPAVPGARVLDLCAGGGGKTLAMAARGAGPLFAHDADPGRMRDLPARAARAGAQVRTLAQPEGEAPFAGVIADVPCSGSGSWRRAPEAKWRLSDARLAQLLAVQAQILDRAVTLVRPDGWVAYMTCSLLRAENDDQADACIARTPGLRLLHRWSCTPLDGGDGFHLSLLGTRS